MSEANNNTAAEETKVEGIFDQDTVEPTEVKTAEKVEATELKPEEKKTEEKSDQPVETELELELPADSGLKAEDVEELKAFAKENGLSKEAAQKLLADKVKTVSDLKAAQVAEVEQRKTKWLEESQSDKEIGGESFNESVEMANRALNEFAPQELRKVLDESGLGNNALVIKTFARIGKKFSNDKLVQAPKSQAAKTVADYDLFYPDQN